MIRSLHEVARAVTCMLDGEVVKTVLTDRAMEKAFVADPRDTWAAGDNWDYNHLPFIKTKQTLERCRVPGTGRGRLYPLHARAGETRTAGTSS